MFPVINGWTLYTVGDMNYDIATLEQITAVHYPTFGIKYFDLIMSIGGEDANLGIATRLRNRNLVLFSEIFQVAAPGHYAVAMRFHRFHHHVEFTVFLRNGQYEFVTRHQALDFHGFELDKRAPIILIHSVGGQICHYTGVL